MSIKPPVIGIVGPDWAAALPSMQPRRHESGTRVTVQAASEVENPDFLAFFGDIAGTFETVVPREKRMILISEPPGILRYRLGFLAQFGTAISPFDLPGFTGRLIRSHPGIPWFYGCTFGNGRKPAWRFSFEELLALPRPTKINAVSAVLSKKRMTPLHAARVTCAEAIARAFPGNVRIFGSGFDPVDDKADAIDPYRFHLALENTRHPDYWSEKIADAWLGWAMPIYDGCPNIEHYFPKDAFARIDVTDPKGAIRTVGALLEAGESAVPLDALAAARDALLREQSLPAVLMRAVDPILDMPGKSASRPETLRPEILRSNAHFSLENRIKSAMWSVVRRQ